MCHKETFIRHHFCAKTALHLQAVLWPKKASVWHRSLCGSKDEPQKAILGSTLRDPRTGGLYPSPVRFIHAFIFRRTSRGKWMSTAMQGKEESYCRVSMKLVQWQLSITNFRHVCTSVSPHAKTRLPLDGFSLKFIFEDFSKICRQNSSIIKIGQEERVLYMTINTHFWSYLTNCFFEWEIRQTEFVGNIKMHILCSVTFFSKILPLMRKCEKLL